MPDLVKALRSGRVLLMDGAMGTELLRGVVARHACLESLNLAQPELVQSVHREYVSAGAEVLLTNTFQANPSYLEKRDLRRQLDAIYQAGVELARDVLGQGGYVVASVGPTMPNSDVQFESLARVAAGIDAVLLETWSSADAAVTFADCDWAFGSTQPALISFAFRRDAAGQLSTYTNRTTTPEECAAVAESHRFAALGVNCGTDIRLPELLEILERYRSVTDLPLFARPNAGTPNLASGQCLYPESPDSMAAWLPALFEAGVVMVGGCCGTTPAHIAAFRKVVDDWNCAHRA